MSIVAAEIVCEVVIRAPVTPKSIREAVVNAIGGPDVFAADKAYAESAFAIEIEAFTVEHETYGSDELQPNCIQAPADLARQVIHALAGITWGLSTQVAKVGVEVWQRGTAPHCYMKLCIQRVTRSEHPYEHLDEVCGACIGTCPVCGQECGRIM